jgi:hypothetical protein
MSEHEESSGNIVELLLREPAVVARLEDYRPDPDGAADDDAPAAA